MAHPVFVLNGPNLNLLGLREPAIYGGHTLAQIEAECRKAGEGLELDVECRQTNHEGVLVDWLHEAGATARGVILNAGAYSHSSIALHDAMRAIRIPVIEVHLSNVAAREPFRHHSTLSSAAAGVIFGFGPLGYVLALTALARRLAS